jgi:hypothetical protein
MATADDRQDENIASKIGGAARPGYGIRHSILQRGLAKDPTELLRHGAPKTSMI